MVTYKVRALDLLDSCWERARSWRNWNGMGLGSAFRFFLGLIPLFIGVDLVVWFFFGRWWAVLADLTLTVMSIYYAFMICHVCEDNRARFSSTLTQDETCIYCGSLWIGGVIEDREMPCKKKKSGETFDPDFDGPPAPA